jgi:hypothetical protein
LKYLVVILFLATLFSCKKEVSNVGYDLLKSDDAFVGAIDTFKINTSTKKMDTITTNQPSYLLIGKTVDPNFGSVEAGFYSQLRLISTSPNFGSLSSITVDSVVLSINYIDKYGVSAPLKFEVYRLTEKIEDKTYYSNSTLTDDGVNLLSNNDMVTPREIGTYFIDNFGDTIYNEITLKLKNELGLSLIEQSINSPSTYSSIDNFNSWFKGLKVKVSNDNLSSGQGAVYYIADAPRLTIYYKVNGVSKKYYYELNKNGNRINTLVFNSNGYEVENSIDKTNYKAYFAQANNLRSYLSLPSLNDINPNSVIHSAKIVLPYDHSDVVKFNPGYQISVSVPNSATDDRLRIVAYGSIDTTNHVFIVDLRDHIQSIVSGKRLNLGLYISPKDFSTTATRIRFLNEGDNAPKLYLKVSSFKQ